MEQATTAIGRQIGGSRYKDLRIHPYTFFEKNRLEYWQLIVIERITFYNRDEGHAYMLQEALDSIFEVFHDQFPA